VGDATVQGSITRAVLRYLDRYLWPKRIIWFWCPTVCPIVTNQFFATSIDSWMYLDSSFDDRLNWIAVDKVGPINSPAPSWLFPPAYPVPLLCGDLCVRAKVLDWGICCGSRITFFLWGLIGDYSVH